MMTGFLLADPSYYNVDYEINSWMSINNKPDVQKARNQWENLRNNLQKAGAKLRVIDPVKGLPDLVFTANAGFFVDNIFVLANFKHKERQKEADIFASSLSKDFQIFKLPKDVYHEGAGDCLKVGDVYYQGYGFRSDLESVDILTYKFKIQIKPLKLKSGYFYHLDTCFCPLKHNNKDYLIYFNDAFEENVEPPCESFNVPEKEAKLFACNAVQYDDKVFLQDGCQETGNWLKSIGITPVFVDMSQFHLAGGSAKCCTLSVALKRIQKVNKSATF